MYILLMQNKLKNKSWLVLSGSFYNSIWKKEIENNRKRKMLASHFVDLFYNLRSLTCLLFQESSK